MFRSINLVNTPSFALSMPTRQLFLHAYESYYRPEPTSLMSTCRNMLEETPISCSALLHGSRVFLISIVSQGLYNFFLSLVKYIFTVKLSALDLFSSAILNGRLISIPITLESSIFFFSSFFQSLKKSHTVVSKINVIVTFELFLQ